MQGPDLCREDQPWFQPRLGVTPLPVADPREPARLITAEPWLRVHLTLRCSLPQAGAVRLTVHDSAGRCVRTLHQGWMAAGEHALAWDQKDDRGRKVYAGLYRVRFEAAGRALSQQVILMP